MGKAFSVILFNVLLAEISSKTILSQEPARIGSIVMSAMSPLNSQELTVSALKGLAPAKLWQVKESRFPEMYVIFL